MPPPESILYLYPAVAGPHSPSEILATPSGVPPGITSKRTCTVDGSEGRAGFPRSHMRIDPDGEWICRSVSPAQANEPARRAGCCGRSCAGRRTRTDIDPFGLPGHPHPRQPHGETNLPPVLVTTPPMRKAATAKSSRPRARPRSLSPPQPRSRRRRSRRRRGSRPLRGFQQLGRSTRNHHRARPHERHPRLQHRRRAAGKPRRLDQAGQRPARHGRVHPRLQRAQRLRRPQHPGVRGRLPRDTAGRPVAHRPDRPACLWRYRRVARALLGPVRQLRHRRRHQLPHAPRRRGQRLRIRGRCRQLQLSQQLHDAGSQDAGNSSIRCLPATCAAPVTWTTPGSTRRP